MLRVVAGLREREHPARVAERSLDRLRVPVGGLVTHRSALRSALRLRDPVDLSLARLLRDRRPLRSVGSFLAARSGFFEAAAERLNQRASLEPLREVFLEEFSLGDFGRCIALPG